MNTNLERGIREMTETPKRRRKPDPKGISPKGGNGNIEMPHDESAARITESGSNQFNEIATALGQALGGGLIIAKQISEEIAATQNSLASIENARESDSVRSARRMDEIERLLAFSNSATNGLKKQVAQVDSHLIQMQDAQEPLEHNLDQLRSQSDGIARKIENLSAGFIERYVREPQFIELNRILNSLLALEQIGEDGLADGIHAVRQDIERHFESQGLKIIHPQVGEQFNPNQHQPIERQETNDQPKHGRIARVYQSGLEGPERTVQPARVAVFVFKENDEIKSKSEEREEKCQI